MLVHLQLGKFYDKFSIIVLLDVIIQIDQNSLRAPFYFIWALIENFKVLFFGFLIFEKNN